MYINSEKVAMQVSKSSYTGGFGRHKGKGEMIYYQNIK